MLILRISGGALLFAGCVLACSSSTESDRSAPPAQVTDAQKLACAEYAAATCSRMDECSAFNIPRFHGTLDNCVASTERRCERDFVLPGMKVTLEALQACTAAIPTAVCGRAFGTIVSGPACELPVGTLELGAACVEDEQCQSGECRFDSSDGCNYCVAPPPRTEPLGAACDAFEGPGCAEGECAFFECRHVAWPGEACGDETTTCYGLLPCRDGVCSPALPEGSACSTDADCVFGYSCLEGVCTEDPPELPAVGAACGIVVQTSCDPATQYCRGPHGAVGQCQPLGQAGETCATDALGNSSCDSLLTCTDGICTPAPISYCD